MNFLNVICHLLAFVVGLSVEMEYELVGTLRVSELLILGFLGLMFAIGRGHTIFEIPFAKTVAVLGVLWLGAQFASDMVNHTSRVNMLKGNANIGMILVSVAGFVLLMRPDPNRFASYMFGLFFSRLITRLGGYSSDVAGTDYWDRFIGGWASVVLVLLLLYFMHKQFKPAYSWGLLFLYGSVAIVFGGRAHGLIFLMTAVGLWFGAKGAPDFILNASRRKVMKAGLALFVALFVIFQVYVFAGLQGYLNSKTKAQLLSTGNPYNPVRVIMAGRGGVQVAVMAISDAPLMGHGSRAYNPKYILRGMRARAKERLTQIPVHSCILGAWVFSGILGVPFWVAALWMHLQMYKSAVNTRHMQFIFLASLLLANGIWQIFFSAFGWGRFSWPPLLAVTIILHYHHELKRAEMNSEEQGDEAVPAMLPAMN